MKRNRVILCLSLVLLSFAATGCRLDSLQVSNRRLRKSNDRLIAENNRLESELASNRTRPATTPQATLPQDSGVTTVSANIPTTPSTRSSRLASARDLLLEDSVQVDEVRQGLRITIDDKVFFAPGEVRLSRSGTRILDKVGAMINSSYPGHTVRVDGHTDDTPVRKVRTLYPTNWELSTARACTVVRYLVENGNVNPGRVFPAGFAYYRPVASGSSANAQKKNRRVEITILNEGG